MDIQKIINDRIDSIITEKKIDTVINDSITKLITSVFNDIFSSYSNFAKELKKAIEEKINLNLQNVEMVDYNHIIATAINKHLLESVDTVSVESIKKLIDKTTGYLNKKHWKLTELYNLVLQEAREESFRTTNEITFIVEENEEHKWCEVFIDLEKMSKDKCALRFIFSTDRGSIFSIHHRGSYDSKRSALGPSDIAMLRGFELLIFRLYAAQVTLEMDETYFSSDITDFD